MPRCAWELPGAAGGRIQPGLEEAGPVRKPNPKSVPRRPVAAGAARRSIRRRTAPLRRIAPRGPSPARPAGRAANRAKAPNSAPQWRASGTLGAPRPPGRRRRPRSGIEPAWRQARAAARVPTSQPEVAPRVQLVGGASASNAGSKSRLGAANEWEQAIGSGWAGGDAAAGSGGGRKAGDAPSRGAQEPDADIEWAGRAGSNPKGGNSAAWRPGRGLFSAGRGHASGAEATGAAARGLGWEPSTGEMPGQAAARQLHGVSRICQKPERRSLAGAAVLERHFRDKSRRGVGRRVRLKGPSEALGEPVSIASPMLRTTEFVVPENLKWTDIFPAIKTTQARLLSYARIIIASTISGKYR